MPARSEAELLSLSLRDEKRVDAFQLITVGTSRGGKNR